MQKELVLKLSFNSHSEHTKVVRETVLFGPPHPRLVRQSHWLRSQSADTVTGSGGHKQRRIQALGLEGPFWVKKPRVKMELNKNSVSWPY